MPLQRHMKFRSKPVFSWIGETIQPPPKDRKSADLPHYKGFTLGTLSVEVGDFVLVKNEECCENLQDCDIARVDRLYEDSSASVDPHRAEITWLCRPNQMPKQLVGHGFEEDGIPELDERLDVVVEARNFEVNICAETIYFKCHVHSQPMSTVPMDFIKSISSQDPQDSKQPHYVLRFKMKGPPASKRGKKVYTLEPYQSREGVSPLKLTSSQNRSPLKERSRNRADSLTNQSPVKSLTNQSPVKSLTNQSPVKSLSPKVLVAKEHVSLIASQVSSPEVGRTRSRRLSSIGMEALVSAQSPSAQALSPEVGQKRRRRLSSRGSNSGDMPLKRVKKSVSVQNSPERPRTPKSGNSEKNPRLTRSARKTESGDSVTPKSTNKGNTSRSTRLTSVSKENTPTRKSARVTIVPIDVEAVKESLKKTPARRRVVSTDDFTEVNAETNSGRKLKITCGNSQKKIAPSSGLGDNAITNMLNSDSDQEFEIDPKEKRQRGRPAAKTPTRVSARSVKSGTKTPSKSTTKTKADTALKKQEPKKRTRRASMSVVEQAPPTTPISKTKRKSMALSETKLKKRLESYSPSVSSDSDFQDEDGSDGDSDFENIVIYKSKKSAVQSQKGKSQNKNSILDRKGFTPSVQQRSKPVPFSSNPMVEAQSRLHVSAVPEELPCREEEFAEIFGFIEGKLQEETGGCIYISGVPGTGKTATVKQVMRYLDQNRDEYPDFNFFELNGMRLTCPEQIYVEMWKHLSNGEKLSAEASLKRLDERFAKAGPRRTPTVFLVDELDMLCKSRKQTVLYNMFEWPSRPQAKLIIVAIANTMDLPERDMDMRVISRLGFNRLNFDPYNQLQLQMIVSSRLQGLEVFQSDEIELVSRKVASLSGDARRALDICRILAERCEREGKARITHVEVLQVHAEMFRSPKIQYIRSCSRMEQFILRALVNEFYRTGVEETNLRNISYRMEELCATEGNDVPSLHCLYNICARMSSQRLILSEDYRKGLDTKLRLNVGFEDVNFALRPPTDMD